MCQSKAEGGRRCAAHNNAREFNRAKRAVKTAVAERDRLAELWDNGDTTVTETLIAAEREVALKADIAVLLDPKITDERLAELWADASPEVQAAAAPVAESAIAHGKAAARLAGQAATERMFDRTGTAEAFETEAAQERSRMARMVSGLNAVLVTAKTDLEEAVYRRRADAADRGAAAATKKNGEPGLFRSWLIETLEATEEAMVETVEGLAAGVGIETADSSETKEAAAAGGQDQDPDEAPAGGDHGVDTDRSEAKPSAGSDAADAAEQTDDSEPYEPDPLDDPERQDEHGEGSGVADDRPAPEKVEPSTAHARPAEPRTYDPAAATAQPEMHVPTQAINHDRLQNQRASARGDRVSGLDNPAPTAAARPMASTAPPLMTADTGHVRQSPAAAPIAVPDDLSTLTDAELAALIEHLQRR